jgi:aryl-alcohol dehydrogenase-like predicted oxidoreductase
MEKRLLGKTGESLSVIGFGGIVVMNVTPEEEASHVNEAIGRGINYFDVAPSYGNAEERLGPALKPYRDQVFLACKTGKRIGVEARTELEGSLRQMQTDRFDLYQFHAVTSTEEAQQILAPGGALDAVLKAREEGLIRHIGFSAHSEEAALYLLDQFSFDSVMFPVNFHCWEQGKFGPRLCEKAVEKGTGIIAIKALAKRRVFEGESKVWKKCWYIPVDTPEEIASALAFTLSKPVTAALCPGHIEFMRLVCDALESSAEPVLKSLSASETPLFRVDND